MFPIEAHGSLGVSLLPWEHGGAGWRGEGDPAPPQSLWVPPDGRHIQESWCEEGHLPAHSSSPAENSSNPLLP